MGINSDDNLNLEKDQAPEMSVSSWHFDWNIVNPRNYGHDPQEQRDNKYMVFCDMKSIVTFCIAISKGF